MSIKIVQLNHPGKQFDFLDHDATKFADFKKGVKFWNKGTQVYDHIRKYIRQSGRYLCANKNKNWFENKPLEDTLYFWGEWEPQSLFSIIQNEDNIYLPNAIHEPVFSHNDVGTKNTDPFVFGEEFYYTNCKQFYLHQRNGEILENGSLIIFGFSMDDHFALDTVFVVKDSITSKEYEERHEDSFPTLLKKATLEHRDLYRRDANLTNPKYRIYRGLMYESAPFNSMFSFVPCLVDKEGVKGKDRVKLDFKKFRLNKGDEKINGVKKLPEIQWNSVYDYWKMIVQEVIEQDYHLGIKIDMPRELTKQEEKKYLQA